jgi:hypothetical protein
MKKLLGIIVLGLLWCNFGLAGVFGSAGMSGTAQEKLIQKKTIKVGMTYKQLRELLFPKGTDVSHFNSRVVGNYMVLCINSVPSVDCDKSLNLRKQLPVTGKGYVFKGDSPCKFGWYMPKLKSCGNHKLIQIENSMVAGLKYAADFEPKFYQIIEKFGGDKNLKTKKELKEEKKIAEKPKKKKPKQLPEDNKVVPAGSGSGFFVSSDGHIITNHHVINGCNTTKVSFKGNQVDAQILAVDKMNDIAILKTNIKPNSIFPISNEDVSLLEDVVVAGYPLGKKVSSAIKTHKGVVTALAGAGDNYSNFQTDASINAGNSGGPIMNQKGNIVGIAVATWVEDGVQGVHFGIKSSTLKTFANSNSLKFSSPNYLELSNKDLGKLITEATVYLECHMTVANIKKMMAAANNRKAFFSEFK